MVISFEQIAFGSLNSFSELWIEFIVIFTDLLEGVIGDWSAEELWEDGLDVIESFEFGNTNNISQL